MLYDDFRRIAAAHLRRRAPALQSAEIDDCVSAAVESAIADGTLDFTESHDWRVVDGTRVQLTTPQHKQIVDYLCAKASLAARRLLRQKRQQTEHASREAVLTSDSNPHTPEDSVIIHERFRRALSVASAAGATETLADLIAERTCQEVADERGIACSTAWSRRRKLQQELEREVGFLRAPSQGPVIAAQGPRARARRRGRVRGTANKMILETDQTSDGGLLVRTAARTRALAVASRAPGRGYRLLAWSSIDEVDNSQPPRRLELLAPVPVDAVEIMAVRLERIPTVDDDELEKTTPSIAFLELMDEVFDLLGLGFSAGHLHLGTAGSIGVARCGVHCLRPRDLNYRDQPIPRSKPRPKRLVQDAMATARQAQALKASALFRRALEVSIAEGDVAATTYSVYGLWTAMGDLGFREAADATLAAHLPNLWLDRRTHDWFAAQAAHNAWMHRDYMACLRWVGACHDPGDPQVLLRRVLAACLGGNANDAIRAASRIPLALLQPDQRWLLDDALAIAIREGRETDQERIQRRPEPLPKPVPHGVSAMWPVRWYWSQIDADGPTDWAAGVDHIRTLLQADDGGMLAPIWQWSVCFLARRAARADSNQEAACQLARLAWLHTEVAASDVPLVAVGHELSLRGGVVRAEYANRLENTQRVRNALVELAGGGGLGEACRELGRWLFPEPLPPGPVLVASDGCLAGAPLHAAYLAAYPQTAHLPAFRGVGELRRRPEEFLAERENIVHIADPHPDDPVRALPGAASEIPPGRAERFHGPQATVRALQTLPPAGLVVISVHLEERPELPVPALQLRDGEVTVDALLTLDLKGRPTVALSGCASAPGRVSQGVQFSLFHALTMAGAGFVLGFTGSVDDDGAAVLMRDFADRWPTADPARALADVVFDQYRSQNERCPPAVWGLWQIQQ